MKKRAIILMLSCVLSISAIGAVSAYADSKQTTATATTQNRKEYETIGEKQSDDDYQVWLKNDTERDIKSISVSVDSGEFTELKFSGKDSFRDDETRILFCTPKTKNEDGTDVKTPPVYDLKIVFTDEKIPEQTLHTIPFGDTDSIEIEYDDSLAYIEFKSKSLRREVSTLTSEKVKNGILTEKEAYKYNDDDRDDDHDDYDDYDDDYDDYDDHDDDDACLDNAVLF